MLPKMIDPRRSADQDIEYREVMQPKNLPRLLEAIEELDGDVAVTAHIFRDEQRRMRIEGTALASARMVCQRCLQSSTHALDAQIDLVIVYTEEKAKALPKELDAWVVGETANLHELIEDELILALPIVAYHEDSSCTAPSGYVPDEPEEDLKRSSPFEVLKDLKISSDQ